MLGHKYVDCHEGGAEELIARLEMFLVCCGLMAGLDPGEYRASLRDPVKGRSSIVLALLVPVDFYSEPRSVLRHFRGW